MCVYMLMLIIFYTLFKRIDKYNPTRMGLNKRDFLIIEHRYDAEYGIELFIECFMCKKHILNEK